MDAEPREGMVAALRDTPWCASTTVPGCAEVSQYHAPAGKDAASAAAVDYLRRRLALVRINALDTQWYAADVDALAPATQLAGVVLPKAASADTVRAD